MRRIAAAALALAAGLPPAAAQTVAIDVARPSNGWFAPTLEPGRVTPLPLGPGETLKGRQGWVEYRAELREAGWYALRGETDERAHRMDAVVDPDRNGGVRFPPARLWTGGRFEAGRIWLDPGAHTIRLRNFFWTGFPALRALSLVRQGAADPMPFRVLGPGWPRLDRRGACRPLEVEAGGTGAPGTLVVTAWRAEPSATQRRTLAIPSAARPTRHSLALPCDGAGDWTVEIRAATEPPNALPRWEGRYAVFDTAPVSPEWRRGRLLAEIDTVARPPDFSSDPPAVTAGPAGPARVTGERGLTAFARAGGGPRQPSWFAYRLPRLSPDRPVFLDMDVPDDAARALVLSVRERGARGYPFSVGMETGREWPLSDRMAGIEALFWPKEAEARLLVTNVHDGARAAVSRIRVHEAVRSDRPAPPPRPAGARRDYVIWNEEGESLLDTVGMRGRAERVHEAADRWLSSLRAAGATAVSPTTLIYSFSLSPSEMNLAFGSPDEDLLGAILLGAERYGLDVIPQLHPRADELAWVADAAALERRLLVSRDGRTSFWAADGRTRTYPPRFDPLDPDVQDWYVRMVGELADRARDFPRLTGIDLRVMGWANPTLNNFGSLDWGYGARTVSRFFADRGLPLPPDLAGGDGPEVAARRHAALTGRLREAWIAWRCERIAALYRRLAARLREARPDLLLYTSVFELGEALPHDPAAPREAGIDPALLSAIPGVRVVNAVARYGRREADETWGRTLRDETLSPAFLAPFATAGSGPRTLSTMHYVEATGVVAPAPLLDLPVVEPAPWTSTALNPPGRLVLERLATAVGLADAASLGDGGNGYVRPPPVVRGFLDEYGALPVAGFRRLGGVPDSVALWQAPGHAYLVNLQPVPVTVALAASGPVARLLGGARVAGADGRGTLRLEPFALAGLRLEDGASVTGAAVELPAGALAAWRERARAGLAAARAACPGAGPPDPARDGRCAALAAEWQAAGRDLESGAVWAARRRLDGPVLARLAAEVGPAP